MPDVFKGESFWTDIKTMVGNLGADFWINHAADVFLGALITALVNYTPAIIRLLRSYFRRDENLGVRYLYHFSQKEARLKFFEHKIRIGRGLRKKYIIQIKRRYRWKYSLWLPNFLRSNWRQVYKGYGKIENGDCVLHFQNSRETVVLRFRGIFDSNQTMHGIWTGVDFHGQIYSTACVLVRDAFLGNKIQEFNSLVNPYYEVQSSIFALILKPPKTAVNNPSTEDYTI